MPQPRGFLIIKCEAFHFLHWFSNYWGQVWVDRLWGSSSPQGVWVRGLEDLRGFTQHAASSCIQAMCQGDNAWPSQNTAQFLKHINQLWWELMPFHRAVCESRVWMFCLLIFHGFHNALTGTHAVPICRETHVFSVQAMLGWRSASYSPPQSMMSWVQRAISWSMSDPGTLGCITLLHSVICCEVL